MCAARCGHTECMQLLIDAGVDKEAKNQVSAEIAPLVFLHVLLFFRAHFECIIFRISATRFSQVQCNLIMFILSLFYIELAIFTSCCVDLLSLSRFLFLISP